LVRSPEDSRATGPMEPQAALKAVLPGYEDVDTLEYMAEVLADSDADDIEENLLDFIEEFTGDHGEALRLIDRLRDLTGKGGGAAAAAPAADEPVKLAAAVVMAKSAKATEDAVAAEVERIQGSVQINSNETITTFEDEDMATAATEEDFIAISRAKKKAGKLEKRAINRERAAAPKRNAILEELTREPVLIHGMVGEDGSYGGNPAVDIQLKDINIDLGGLVLLEDTNLTLAYGRRYGLIGKNGSGKTTFLKHVAAKALDGIPWYLQILHISQEISGDNASALDTVLATDVERAALIAQRDYIEGTVKDFDREKVTKLLKAVGLKLDETADEATRLGEIYERLEEIEADVAEARASAILAGLSFTPEMMKQPTSELSGGWRMRVSLARALFIEPDVLLLDEPTNHLDLHAVVWLEQYLQKYENTVVVVSHARDFLNEIVTDVLELDKKKIKRYKGDYDTFERTKADALHRDLRAKESADKKRDAVAKFVSKNIGGGSKAASMAKSRQKMLDKMAVYDAVRPESERVTFRIPNPGPVAGGWGIRLVGMGFGYPGKELLFSKVEFSINQNSRICLVGPNGIGKTTLLNVIYQELEPTNGLVTRNQRLRVGRFSQHQVDSLTMKASVLEHMQKTYPDHPVPKIRKHLGQMGVSGDLQVRPIYTLSGGQRSRIALALITYTEPHLLLLDEPTNHLDLDSVQGLIRALMSFQGGVFVVSHDEHLISAVCDELWIIRDKKVHLSEGDFQGYKKTVLEDMKRKRHPAGRKGE